MVCESLGGHYIRHTAKLPSKLPDESADVSGEAALAVAKLGGGPGLPGLDAGAAWNTEPMTSNRILAHSQPGPRYLYHRLVPPVCIHRPCGVG